MQQLIVSVCTTTGARPSAHLDAALAIPHSRRPPALHCAAATRFQPGRPGCLAGSISSRAAPITFRPHGALLRQRAARLRGRSCPAECRAGLAIAQTLVGALPEWADTSHQAVCVHRRVGHSGPPAPAPLSCLGHCISVGGADAARFQGRKRQHPAKPSPLPPPPLLPPLCSCPAPSPQPSDRKD